MFRTNNNRDRVNYSNALLPPEGYTLEKAVGTTYSLDLEALTAVCIALGLKEDPDSDLFQNPISMLNALVKVSEKILIFCEAGQIKKPMTPSPLMLLLDKMVIPVALTKKQNNRRFPAFHPKTWVLQYRNQEGQRKYRFVVLSRNLTFDRSWDVSICIESSDAVSQPEKTKPIISFLHFLQKQIGNAIPGYPEKRRLIDELSTELRDVAFSLENHRFGENFTIMPLGIGSEGFDLSRDPLYCQFPGKADYSFNELVVFSPFLSGSVIGYWNRPEHTLAGTTRTLITRRSELPKLTADKVSRFRIFVLKDEIVDGEDFITDEEFEKQKQDIHAKIYIRRKYNNVDLYIGSMNASYAAIHENVEMMIRIGTRWKYYGGQNFLEEIFCGTEESLTNPFEEVQVTAEKQDVPEDETKVLEHIIKELCRMRKWAEAVPAGDRYHVSVHIEGTLQDKGAEIMLAPLRRSSFLPISRNMLFPDMEVLQLTDFYQVQVKRGSAEITRIIMIPTAGLPDERESAVVNSVIKDKKSFIEYIAFILGDDYLLSLLEESVLGKSGFFGSQADRLPALYEKMLKTALEDPARLKEIEYVLKMIHDKDIIPDEFRTLYDTFKATLNLN